MGVFQASMWEAMKSLRDEMPLMKKASEAEVDKTTPLSKAGLSKQPDPTTRDISDHLDAQPMDMDLDGPPLPPKFNQSVQSNHASKHSDLESDHHSDPHSEDHLEQPKSLYSKAKKHSDKKKHKVRAKYYSQLSFSKEDQSSVPIKKPTKPQQKAPHEPEHLQDSTDPVFYRKVDMSDLP